MFFTKSLPEMIFAAFRTYLQTISIVGRFVPTEFQCISLTKLHASGECLYTNGTQDVLEQRSCMTSVISLAAWIFSVGKILPLSYNIPFFLWISADTAMFWQTF